MATTSTIQGDLFINGTLTPKAFTPPASSITSASVTGPIAASKLEMRRHETVTQVHGTAAATERRVIATVRGTTGTIVAFRAGCVVANVGAATVTVDLKKNGTTVLTSVITLDSANAAYAIEDAAGFTSTALVANDVLEVVIVATAGGGTLGQGLFIHLTYDETPT